MNGNFSVFLHYELNPYEKAVWVNSHIPKEQYESYLNRRNRFTKMLKGKIIKELIFGGGTNQIGKANFDFCKYSVKDAKNVIGNIFQVTANVVDNILKIL